MKKINLTIIALAFIFFAYPNITNATIDLSNGYWDTSFNCNEWTSYSSMLDCSGLEKNANNLVFRDDDQKFHNGEIIEDANNGQGRGYRAVCDKNVDSFPGATCSNGLMIVLPELLNEYWMRWDMRFENNWDSGFYNFKTFYFYDDEGDPFGILELNGDGKICLLTKSGYPGGVYEACSFNNQGLITSGAWHTYEAHFKQGNPGTFQLWVDNELLHSRTNLAFDQEAGFKKIEIGVNIKGTIYNPDNGMYIDYDNIALATPEYDNFILDSEGNQRIGPIDNTSNDIFFEDSFESGDLSYANQVSGATWAGRNYGSDGDSVSVSADRAYTGQYSLKFNFGGNTDLDDDAFAEERFNLGSEKDEVYIRYYLWVPDNFTMRRDSGDNNKFMRLWGDEYGDPMQVGVSYRSEGVPFFKSKSLGYNVDPNFNHAPNCAGATDVIFPAEDYKTTTSLYDMKGKWTSIEMHYKRDTGAGDGAFEMWIDGAQEIDKHNISWIGAPCSPGYFKNGYLLGWANSGFDEDTIFYIDDVVFSDSYIEPIGGGDEVVIRADVNQDQQINTIDAMLALRNSLGLDMTETAWVSSVTTGDVNCDKVSNSTDAMLILRYSLGLSMNGTAWCG